VSERGESVVRTWYLRTATVVGVVVYAITVFLAAYLILQGHTFEGVVVLGLVACGVPLVIGRLRKRRTERLYKNPSL
jgi:hypothetical protein